MKRKDQKSNISSHMKWIPLPIDIYIYRTFYIVKNEPSQATKSDDAADARPVLFLLPTSIYCDSLLYTVDVVVVQLLNFLEKTRRRRPYLGLCGKSRAATSQIQKDVKSKVLGVTLIRMNAIGWLDKILLYLYKYIFIINKSLIYF